MPMSAERSPSASSAGDEYECQPQEERPAEGEHNLTGRAQRLVRCYHHVRD